MDSDSGDRGKLRGESERARDIATEQDQRESAIRTSTKCIARKRLYP